MMLIIDTIYAEKSSVTFTPFDISFSEKDFTKMGPSHQILILKPGDTATIPVKIKNYDTVQHQITFSSPNVNLGSLFDSYYFEPETILVKPSSEQETLLHMKIKDNTDIHMSVVSLLAQSESFGMVGKYFYVVVAEKDKITEADLVDVDRSLREDLPGPAFPNLYNDFRTQPPELQNVLDKITINKFGVPRYLPNGYSFQGLTTPYPHPGFVYAPTKVTNTTESVDFWRSGGLLVGYETNTLNFNLTTWLPGYVAQNEAQQIIVNGLVGVATQQQERVTIEGYKYKFPAEIVLFDKYSEIYLRGNMPLEELLKVAESIPVPVTENPPLILSKVELWGPSSFVANDVKSCVDNTVGQLGPWAVGWIEIQNTRDKTITAQDIAFRTGSIQSIIPITLEPNESCVIQTEDQVTTRIGPGGSEGNGPPHGYDGSAVVFEYFVEENSKKIRYVDTTPEISDTFGDARIWQFVDGKWIFKETQPSLEDLLNRARQNIQPADVVIDSNSPPLKQYRAGFQINEIKCKEDLTLAIKARDGSPACVKPETKQKLIERGWAISDSKPIADSSPDQTKETYLSMTVEEWKDMSKQQVMELYNKNELSFDDLGKFLIKDAMEKELKRHGIENKHEDFMVFQGIVLTSLPPHIAYHAVVNSTDGKSYLLAGSTFSNEIESIKIDELVVHSDVFNPPKAGSGRMLPFEELLAMEPKVTIVPPEGNKARVVPHGLILNLEQNNMANFYNNLDVPIQIDGPDYTSIVPEEKKVWKSDIIQPGESGKVQFNVTGYYEYIARTGEDNLGVAGMGTIIAYSNETKNLPFAEKLRIAGEFIQHSDIPWTSIEVGNDKGVTLGFSPAIFHMIPDAERYYKARAQQWIPFDVPIIIEVPK